ncbi:MAG: FAD-dependent oxidoreductase [Oscillospiraceae bacterium]|nr:FAD-dependent oxidoreductase [Oscillospiraceae bacterium]
MLTEQMLESIKKVEATRPERLKTEPRRLTAEEKDALLREFHPDYKDHAFDTIGIGPNKGERAPQELADLLNSNSLIHDVDINLDKVDYEADVLIIGGGGAGAAAAVEAHLAGASVLIVTKLRLGDANSMMAQGGIQAATKENDSPMQHYLDAFGGGHYAAKPELLKRLVMDGPGCIEWLNNMGVLFDKEPDGTMVTTGGGGISRKRLLASKDYTGMEIMRVLRDEVRNLEIPVIEFTAALDLLLDENGNAAGAVLKDLETGEYKIAKGKTVIIATGGAGRLHYQGFPTSNHYGATADGLIMAYRAGANLLYQDTIQYHPTGVAYPVQLFGALVTEKVRAIGAMLLNIDGEAFVHPLETRDVAASAIIRECNQRNRGIPTPNGYGAWLDTPLIDMINGKGFIQKSIPAVYGMYKNYGIDVREIPVLVYPTIHYQNGGMEIDADATTPKIKNLFVGGEASGGIHGRNRVLGNSVLDFVVFGRFCGQQAAKKVPEVKLGKKLSLEHVYDYSKALKEAGIETDRRSPKLFPDYTREVN